MHKRLLLVVTMLALVAGLVLGGQAPASASDVSCSGYTTVSSMESAGHRLSTQANICVNDVGPGATSYWAYGAVMHFKCYRDGVLFGDGTGGCRWAGRVALYDLTSNKTVFDQYWDNPGSSTTAYIQDSGREYSATANAGQDNTVKVCFHDSIVKYMGTTGIEYGIFNMADKCSGTTHH
jgi:hypothetical protein